MQQSTKTILMVRPTSFRANEQTAVNNHYQKEITNISQEDLQTKAQQEFNNFVEKLKNIGVNVVVFNSTDNLDTPDAHFPNNWISFHENGTVGLYPMFAENEVGSKSMEWMSKLARLGPRFIDHGDRLPGGLTVR